MGSQMSKQKRYEATLVEEVSEEYTESLYGVESGKDCENCLEELAIATMLMCDEELRRLCRECCIGVLDEPEWLLVSNHGFRGN